MYTWYYFSFPNNSWNSPYRYADILFILLSLLCHFINASFLLLFIFLNYYYLSYSVLEKKKKRYTIIMKIRVYETLRLFIRQINLSYCEKHLFIFNKFYTLFKFRGSKTNFIPCRLPLTLPLTPSPRTRYVKICHFLQICGKCNSVNHQTKKKRKKNKRLLNFTSLINVRVFDLRTCERISF